MEEKIIQKSGKYFTETEKHQIIQEFLATKCTKRFVWNKYTGQDGEHGQLTRWMRDLGYDEVNLYRKSNFEANIFMAKKKIKLELEEDSFESLQLKNRIKELEKQLKEAELKAIAFSTMVEIAEKEFKIPIRKKFNTKP
jgi:transposase